MRPLLSGAAERLSGFREVTLAKRDGGWSPCIQAAPENAMDLKLTPEMEAFRKTLSDEYSKPPPGPPLLPCAPR